MRAVCQRVTQASVRVDGDVVGQIDAGLLIFLGIGPDDTESVATALAAKISGLRIFADQDDRMNLSVVDAGGECLIVSQFTLYGDCKKGRRPFFGGAAAPEQANRLCEVFRAALSEQVRRVETGRFGADMDVALNNDGPVTLILDSEELGLS
tara:strand:- start:192 stop:647 length:456 start_codon:yes stop_codon:yes gene_type:complete